MKQKTCIFERICLKTDGKISVQWCNILRHGNFGHSALQVDESGQ